MRVLPTVKVGEKTYFHDERLKEYRNVENPLDSIDYADCELCYKGNCPHTCHARCEFHRPNEIADLFNQLPCGCSRRGVEEGNADTLEDLKDSLPGEEELKGSD